MQGGIFFTNICKKSFLRNTFYVSTPSPAGGTPPRVSHPRAQLSDTHRTRTRIRAQWRTCLTVANMNSPRPADTTAPQNGTSSYRPRRGNSPPNGLHPQRRGEKTTGNRVRFPVVFPTASVKLSVLESRLVRNGQLLASLGATRSQHLAAVGRSHSLAESVLVDPLAARRLISSFHCHNDIVFMFVLLRPPASRR